jgi:transcriptional regulator with XRE-family HTH domain
MASPSPSIELDLVERLRDPDFRQEFFLAESSSLIAKQLIELRKRRGLTQVELAVLADTGQPAISRFERADYHGWSFRMLRKLAQKLNARLRVYIEAAEDIIEQYDEAALSSGLSNLPAGAAETDAQSQVLLAGTTRSSVSKSATKEPSLDTQVQRSSGLERLEQRPWS